MNNFSNDTAAILNIANSCANEIEKNIFETVETEEKYYLNIIQLYATTYSLALILYMLSQTKQKSELKLLTKDIALKWHDINSNKLDDDFTRHLDKKLQERIKGTQSVFAKFENVKQSAFNNPIRAISKGFLLSISKDSSAVVGEDAIVNVFLSFHELVLATAETFPNGNLKSNFLVKNNKKISAFNKIPIKVKPILSTEKSKKTFPKEEKKNSLKIYFWATIVLAILTFILIFTNIINLNRNHKLKETLETTKREIIELENEIVALEDEVVIQKNKANSFNEKTIVLQDEIKNYRRDIGYINLNSRNAYAYHLPTCKILLNSLEKFQLPTAILLRNNLFYTPCKVCHKDK